MKNTQFTTLTLCALLALPLTPASLLANEGLDRAIPDKPIKAPEKHTHLSVIQGIENAITKRIEIVLSAKDEETKKKALILLDEHDENLQHFHNILLDLGKPSPEIAEQCVILEKESMRRINEKFDHGKPMDDEQLMNRFLQFYVGQEELGHLLRKWKMTEVVVVEEPLVEFVPDEVEEEVIEKAPIINEVRRVPASPSTAVEIIEAEQTTKEFVIPVPDDEVSIDFGESEGFGEGFGDPAQGDGKKDSSKK